MAEFVTSDWHFSHNNICGKDGFETQRTVFKDVEEMNATIIENHNKVVEPGDTVYFLGDFSLNNKQKDILDLVLQLNGNIRMVLGNHDSAKKSRWVRSRLREAGKPEKFDFEEVGYRIKHKGKLYLLTHYPMTVGQQRESIRNLCGHIHGEPAYSCNSLNVGLDSPEIPEGPFGEPVKLATAIQLVEDKYNAYNR